MQKCRSVVAVDADDSGQVTVLAAVAVCALLVMMLALVALGNRIVARADLQVAADVVALAAVTNGDAAALRVAAANNVDVAAMHIQRDGLEVRVDLAMESTSATAQARGGTTQIQGLIPALRAALARAGQLVGEPIVVVSGWRSPEEQEALWAARATNGYPVAEPGTSLHERGRAVDVPAGQADLLASVAGQVGLCQPLPISDPIHFTWCGAR